jgi:predicted transcriptional regulator
MKKTWRQEYAPIIYQIIQENKGKTGKELKRILSDANPGEYKHMQGIWANEYMRQLREAGLIKAKPDKNGKSSCDNQNTLFKDI